MDPRLYQIATLASLVVYGMGWLEFDITPGRAALLLATVLATQAAGDRLEGRTANWKSALISGLSLCLLLRTNDAALAVLAAVITIASKFVVRFRGKHIFNPTNGGLVAMLLLSDRVWVSPGQWGSVALFALLMASVGGLVVNRASRSDVTFAFIACYCALIFGRSIYLGEPMTIPVHRLQSGALLLFTFFMISDPKTTPNSRAGRVLFAALVAFGAWYVQFRLFRTNGLLWSLALWSAAVPLIDRLLPGRRYAWQEARAFARVQPGLKTRPLQQNRPLQARGLQTPGETTLERILPMKRIVAALALAVLIVWSAPTVLGFCGFYVAKADSKLFNRASQVVLVRDGDRTVLTMANDYQGSLKEFAVVVPVPTFLRREQIHVGDRALVEHLDAYSAPRLVEYFDANPCLTYPSARPLMAADGGRGGAMRAREDVAARSHGVTIEAKYTVGEYDILILSAQQSSGLEAWLKENGYRIPAGASEVLGSYLKQNMRFFVAKVNLAEQAKLGYSFLRPLQVAYESPKFMLPIRLGMVNADGAQELFVYALTRRGRVETTNYRTVRLPTGMELPGFLKDSTEFAAFYKSMFLNQLEKQDGRAVFLEHAWDTKWCDPCAADPLSADELRRLGVFWDDGGPAPNVFVTRLHVRYDKAHFPEDLVFQETADRTNFQGRYVVRHAWTGDTPCEAATTYRRSVAERRELEAQRLSELTGWTVADIRKKMGLAPGGQVQPAAWWERIWR